MIQDGVIFVNIPTIYAYVKSNRGILFRKWTSSILKQYLLQGQVINEGRCLAHADNILQMNNTIWCYFC